MRHILFLISASYVSAGRYRALADALVAAAVHPARAIRLDREGEGLWAALDALTEAKAREIELRPLGLPFSQSLERWLPGAAGAWLAARADADASPRLLFAAPLDTEAGMIEAVARATPALTPIPPKPMGHHGKGWDAPPAFRHHLFVCTGPRCHMQDAPSLAQSLTAAIRRAGLSRDCLVTTTGCLFPCNAGPVVVEYPAGGWYRLTDSAAVDRFVEAHLGRGEAIDDLKVFQTGDMTDET